MNIGTWPRRLLRSARSWNGSPGLQPQTLALGARLSASSQVRGPADSEKCGDGYAATGRMSFLTHRRSFRPMWQEQTGSRLGSYSRISSARMSRCRLFLGGSVSTGARFRFIGCGQNAVPWSCRSSNLQRMENSVLFGGLRRGVHPSVNNGRLSDDPSRPRRTK
jgi:hypothetical protein